MIDFKVRREELLTALQNVGNAVKDNKTIPSLSGIYLEVKESSVEVKGTDLEMSISAKLNAEVTSPGIAVIKSTTLLEYLKEINEESIRVQQIGNEININTSNSSSNYSIMDHTDYPETFNFSTISSVNVDSDKFVEGIEKTIVGAATTPDNLAVHSVRLDIAENSMRIITSDTYRLFFYESPINTTSYIKASIPLRTANSILKVIKNLDAKSIVISFAKNLIHIKIGNIELLSKLIDLPYPDYENIIGSFSSNKEVLCDSEELVKMLKRVQLFARDNSDVRNGATFTFNDKSLEVKAISDQAKVKENMLVLKKGDNISISLNVKFILDFVNQLHKNTVIKLSNEDSAVLFAEEGSDKFLCLAMPLSLG